MCSANRIAAVFIANSQESPFVIGDRSKWFVAVSSSFLAFLD